MVRGELVWSEDFDLRVQCGGRDVAKATDPLRPVPAVLLQALRNSMQAALTGDEVDTTAATYPEMCDPQDGEEEEEEVEGEQQQLLLQQRKVESTAALKRQGLERALGRHVEAMADAAVSMVANCVREAAILAEKDTAMAIFDEPSDSDSGLQRESQGTNCTICGERIRTAAAAHACSIGWRAVLNAVQVRTRDLERQDKMSLRVHPNLPALRLTPDVVSRFETRVLALYGGQAPLVPASVRRGAGGEG